MPRQRPASAIALLIASLTAAACGPVGPAATPQAPPAPPDPTPLAAPVSAPSSTAATAQPPPTDTPYPSPTLPPTETIPPVVALAAVGDLMLGRSIGDRILAEGPGVVFANVQSALAGADVLVGNLECTLSPLGSPERKAYAFAGPAQGAEALRAAGFDVVSQANNHALDFGPVALADTRYLLEQNGIAVVGAGATEQDAHAPAIVERNGLVIAFLAYVAVPVERGGFDTRSWAARPDSPGVAWADPDRIRADAAAARAQADTVVVLLHTGLEGRPEPEASQVAAARAAIDGGAALVLGSHPHVLQKAQPYQQGLIVYSLGNFVFDGFGLPENYTAIFRATLTPEGVRDYQWIPAVIERGLPRLATPEEAAVILQRIQ